MQNIQWDQSFSVGVADIDAQHRKLVEMINALTTSQEGPDSYETASDIISRLVEYLDVHFMTEQTYMQETQYPEYRPHMAEHRAFIKKVLDFRKRLTRDNQGLVPEMVDFLTGWLRHHIMEIDKRLGEYLVSLETF